jgi:hypothetical protein
MRRHLPVVGFLAVIPLDALVAPHVVVKRKDGCRGSLEFQHRPRSYRAHT